MEPGRGGPDDQAYEAPAIERRDSVTGELMPIFFDPEKWGGGGS